jgi:hypothetical protein
VSEADGDAEGAGQIDVPLARLRRLGGADLDVDDDQAERAPHG